MLSKRLFLFEVHGEINRNPPHTVIEEGLLKKYPVGYILCTFG